MKTPLFPNVMLEDRLQRDIGRGLPRPYAPYSRRVFTADLESADGGHSLRMLPAALMAFEGVIPQEPLDAMRTVVEHVAETFATHPSVCFSIDYNYAISETHETSFDLRIADVDPDKPRVSDWHHDAVKLELKITPSGPVAEFYRNKVGGGIGTTRVAGVDRIAASLVRRIRKEMSEPFARPGRIFEDVLVTGKRRSRGSLARLTAVRRDPVTGLAGTQQIRIERFCALFGRERRLALPMAVQISHFGDDGKGGLLLAEASRIMPHLTAEFTGDPLDMAA